MIRIAIALVSILAIQSAFSFETGNYHGVNGTQVCDLDMVQNLKSVTLNKLTCQETAQNYDVDLEPTELHFGHFEIYDEAANTYVTADATADRMNLVIKDNTNKVTFFQELVNLGSKKVQFRFQIASNGNTMTWFDVVLTKK
ncbi:MAG: hypothetical protein WC635_15365 [Bacteriovorax sp.]|jgi:hypothetical protein